MCTFLIIPDKKGVKLTGLDIIDVFLYTTLNEGFYVQRRKNVEKAIPLNKVLYGLR